MKSCLLLLILALSAPLAAQVRPVTLSPVDLILDVPAQWSQSGDGDAKSPLVLASLVTGDTVHMTRTPVAKMVAIDPAMQEQIINGLKNTPGVTIVGSDFSDFATVSAFRVNATNADHSRQMVLYTLCANGHLITATFISMGVGAPTQNSALAQAISSARFKNPPRTYQTELLKNMNAAQGAGYFFGSLLCCGGPIFLIIFFIVRRRKNKSQPTSES